MSSSITADFEAELAILRLSRYVAGADFNPTQETEDLIRMALVDTFGCFLSGVNQPVARRAQAAFVGFGPATAPVFGTPLCTEPSKAALLNAVAGHALEFDDWEMVGNTHPSNVLFAAILAAASDKALSGKAIVDAYLAGFEVIARLGEAINFEHYDQGWHATGTLGAIGAAASVARLWKLDANETAHALSIATSRAIAFTSQFGSETKPLQAGFAAEAGIVAAKLAQQGLTGQLNVLDAPKGYFALTGHDDLARHRKALDKIGAGLALQEHGLVFKLYPSCGYTHRLIDCALAVVKQGAVSPHDVVSIDLHLPSLHAAVVPFMHPSNRPEALFSLPFCVSTALLKGDVTLADFDTEFWNDPRIHSMIEKTQVKPFAPQRPDLNYAPEDPDRIDITMNNGMVRSASVVYPEGSPPNPATDQRLIDKFMITARLGSNLADVSMKQALDHLLEWPSAGNVHDHLSMFSLKQVVVD